MIAASQLSNCQSACEVAPDRRASLTVGNKLAVSLAYLDASGQPPDGNILIPHNPDDEAYAVAVRAVGGVTVDPSTAEIAIAGIHNAVAEQDLSLIVQCRMSAQSLGS
jgi:hypothetical protein